MTLQDLIQIAADEGREPADVVLVFQADADSDLESLTVLDDPQRGTAEPGPFVLVPEGR